MSASANRYDLRRIKEVTWNQTPTSPALTFVRNLGESLSESISTERSQEIRPDRTTADLIPVDASVGGSFNFELSYGSYDDFIEAALMSQWVTLAFSGAVTTVASATDNLTATGAFTNIVVGQLIVLGGATDPALNRAYRVISKTSNDTVTVLPQPASSEAVAAGTIDGSALRNGVLEQSFTMVKRFNDATPVTTQVFTGMRVTGFNFDLSTASLITGAFNFLGSRAEWDTDPAFAGETSNSLPYTPVMNAVTNLVDVDQDGTNLCATGALSNLTFELDNQHREQKAICTFGSRGIIAGQLLINFSGSQYFVNSTEAQKFKSGTPFSFSFTLQDNLGNQYNIYTPKNKYESFEVNASGLDTDVMAETSFTALYDEATNTAIVISRIPASVGGGTT